MYEVVKHEGSDARASPLRVGEDEGNVSLVILDIGHEKSEAHNALPVQHNTAEVWILQAFGD